LPDATPPLPPPPLLLPQSPSLGAIFVSFLRIGTQSFGGGTSMWIRRELVQRRGWLQERPFLAGLALCQIAPGANSMNMAVFAGTTLRGVPGALVAISGLMLLPVAFVLVAGWLYFAGLGPPGLQITLSGVGAAAIGLNLANGIQLTGLAVRNAGHAMVMLGVALAIGVLGFRLLPVLGVALPVSWAVTMAYHRAKLDPR
jgi:chromate transporter